MRRDGFTLVELLVALTIMTIVLVGMARFAASFMHAVGTSATRTFATSVAVEQLGAVTNDPTYPLPASWVTTTTGFPGYPAMVRRTVLTRVVSAVPRRDYTRVTVKVWEPTLRRVGVATPDTINLTTVVLPR